MRRKRRIPDFSGEFSGDLSGDLSGTLFDDEEVFQMIKENRKTLIIASIVTVLPILAGVLVWDRLPDLMATHFGLDNQANGFSSKPVAVFGIPLFCLALLWAAALFTSGDPRRKNVSRKVTALTFWVVPAVSLVCAAAIYPYNLGIHVDISFIMGIFLGAMFAAIGNYLPKTRQNYTIGIKVPWTLDNEKNWNMTHRFGGYLWMAGGILMIILTLAGLMKPGVMIAILLIISLVPCIYSWWLHSARGY